MSLSRVKVWVAGEVLTAADLNGEFNNILTNPMALITPLILQNLATVPGVSDAGRVYFNTDKNMVEVDDGTLMRTVPTMVTTDIEDGSFIVGTVVTSTDGTVSDQSWQIVSRDNIGINFSYAENGTGAGLAAIPVL